jgi:hypothetical protein
MPPIHGRYQVHGALAIITKARYGMPQCVDFHAIWMDTPAVALHGVSVDVLRGHLVD